MNIVYILTPFCTWLVVGGIKFLINSYKEKRLAFDLIGYGGLPSNHSAIISSTLTLIYCDEGSSSVFGLGVAIGFLVVLDSLDLRRKIGLHAKHINELREGKGALRERVGHTKLEVLCGLCVGVVIGLLTYQLSGFL